MNVTSGTGMPPPAPIHRGGVGARRKPHGGNEEDDGSDSSDGAHSSLGRRARDLGMDRRRPRGGEDDDEHSSGSEVDEERDTTMSVSCALSEALVSDINAQREVVAASTTGVDEEAANSAGAAVRKAKQTACCVCGGEKAQYTCPGCKKRTCSLTCVRMHKAHDKCSGERNVTGSVPLSEFSDAQLRRDFHFLEDCRRIADTAASRRPKDGFHYSYHALPPPLFALRESAKTRGVLLQLISEGMRKRDVNSTRYDKRTDTITWHVEFRFVCNAATFLSGEDAGTSAPVTVQGLSLRKNFKVATSWGNERHLLGDVMTGCARVNPKLPLFHIRRGYSRASRWVTGGDLQARTKRTRGSTAANEEGAEATAADEGESITSASTAPVEIKISESVPQLVLLPEDSSAAAALEEEVPMTAAAMVANTNVKRFVDECGGISGLAILHRAERLGDRVLYFPMNSQATLHENLRTLFFLNEFPEFLVVRAEDVPLFELVSDVDKEAIRESFRKKEKPTLQQRLATLPKKADLDAQTADLYSKIPCRQFVRGSCVRPEGECPYWHCAPSEVPACRHMALYGECNKGKKCSFQHDPEVVAAAKKELDASPQQLPPRWSGRRWPRWRRRWAWRIFPWTASQLSPAGLGSRRHPDDLHPPPSNSHSDAT